MKITMRIISLMLALGVAGALSAQTDIAFDSVPNLLKLPNNIHLGEVAGVATNSKGSIYVLTRSGDMWATTGTSRTFTHGGVHLYSFDSNGKYTGEIGQNLYGFLYGNAVRVDKNDNIWVVDRGASLVIQFAPDGHVIWPMGRKPESINIGPPGGGGRGRGGPNAPPPGSGSPGDLFNQPSDVAWNAAGEIYVADGFGNARVGKYDTMGHFIKSWGHKGSGQGEFDQASSIQVDAQGNVYVADSGNKRIQVFDGEGNFKGQITGVGTPRTICINPGAQQFLYVSNSNPVDDYDHGGEIYKLDLTGKILGKFGEVGKQMKQFGAVNEIDCRRPNELYVAEVGNWRVQKLTLRP